jgi:hypothetical protein
MICQVRKRMKERANEEQIEWRWQWIYKRCWYEGDNNDKDVDEGDEDEVKEVIKTGKRTSILS